MSIELGQIIRKAREAKGLDQVQLGKRFGVSKSAVNQWETGKNVPDHKKHARLARELDLDPAMIGALAAGEKWPPEAAQTSLLDAPPSPSQPSATPPNAPPNPVAADIPVWASVAAGDGDGEMILTSEPIDFIRRSERTANVRDPFAFHVVGESMLERLAQGDQVVINPAMPLLPMTDCVFIHQAEDGMMYGLVKRLLRASGDTWKVRQLNPPRDYELSRKKWTKAYRVAEIRPKL
jgi:transcriptional regulator with XRE-family HTH domain